MKVSAHPSSSPATGGTRNTCVPAGAPFTANRAQDRRHRKGNRDLPQRIVASACNVVSADNLQLPPSFVDLQIA
uniref:Uncharacterized protein n=1 Tax=Manihot esculenta TaxID=3983 RepID=A0A2C9U4L2_MANES